jgi:hypothetical protein
LPCSTSGFDSSTIDVTVCDCKEFRVLENLRSCLIAGLKSAMVNDLILPKINLGFRMGVLVCLPFSQI